MESQISFIKIGRIAVILQIFTLIIGVIINLTLGAVPSTVESYFMMYHDNWIIGMIRDESYNIVLIFLYLFSITALLYILRGQISPMLLFGSLFIYISVVLVLNLHTGFSMMYLGNQYYSTDNAEIQNNLLKAGAVLIAQNMWHSSGGFFAGILMQGGWFMVTLVMGKTKLFLRLTVISGLLSNGLDLINHLIHYSWPNTADIFLYVAGPFYLIWYICLIKEYTKIIRRGTL